MSSHKTARGAAQRRFWEEAPFGEYLNAVDEQLEMLIGRDTTQTELDYTAELQEQYLTPWETAWAVAKESFFKH
jgi:hypothetical protein